MTTKYLYHICQQCFIIRKSDRDTLSQHFFICYCKECKEVSSFWAKSSYSRDAIKDLSNFKSVKIKKRVLRLLRLPK